VITGASSGMGKEICYRYAERGCKIVIGSRNIKDLNAVGIIPALLKFYR
jgi:NAD(P)-dependent dehydrogenase (short-subunit alcohol dehydrogenase family)